MTPFRFLAWFFGIPAALAGMIYALHLATVVSPEFHTYVMTRLNRGFGDWYPPEPWWVEQNASIVAKAKHLEKSVELGPIWRCDVATCDYDGLYFFAKVPVKSRDGRVWTSQKFVDDLVDLAASVWPETQSAFFSSSVTTRTYTWGVGYFVAVTSAELDTTKSVVRIASATVRNRPDRPGS